MRGESSMQLKTVENVMKHSLVYGYAITQPFTLFADAEPIVQHTLFKEIDQINYGSTNDSIEHVQYKLTKLGYYDDKMDGSFGLLTEHAVKKLQSSNHLAITGKVNSETVEAISWEEKEVDIKAIEPLLDSITYGDENVDVKVVQEVLLYYGYYHGSVDSTYGPLTEQAIDQVKNDVLQEVDEQEEVTVGTNEVTSNDELESKPKTDKDPELADDQNEDEEVIQLEVEKNDTSIISHAKSYLGTPYVWGGTAPSGFDCSGYIQFLYAEQNIVIPRTVNEIWNFSSEVSSPSVGDLVFFETYQAGPSHLGIYLGNNEFIHAGSSNGVEISELNGNDYWESRYLGAKRISN